MGEWKKTGCNMCGLACNLEAYVENDHILDIRPNPEGTRNKIPYCCRKGRSSVYLQDNPERLNYPLKKVGDHFERISWEQAYKEIAEKANAILEKYGPKSFAILGGAQAHQQSDVGTLSFLLQAVGGQYAYQPLGIEFMGSWWANGRVIGHQGHLLDGEAYVDEVDAFIYWGSNSYVSHNVMHSSGRFFIKEMSEHNDKKIIVVDPRLSQTARMADMHVMPRHGTDALLVRGLIALIIDKGWEDREYIEKWVSDWDKAKVWYEGFDYKKAFEVCKVPLEQMEELAKILTTCTWGIHEDLGIFFNRHNTIVCFLLNVLMAITGNLLTKGNRILDNFLPFGPDGDEFNEGYWKTNVTGRISVCHNYPVAVMADEMLGPDDKRLHMMFGAAANPIISFPDALNLRKGLENLDLFVMVEIVPTESTRYADYVLPGKTGFETPQWSNFTNETVFLKRPIIGQIGERENDGNIYINIAKAMGIIPEMPEEIYQLAADSVKDRDIVPFLGAAMEWFGQHPELSHKMNLTLLEALARPEAFGNADTALMRIAMATSWLGATEFCDRAGFAPLEKYRNLPGEQGAQIAAMSKMDQAFWAVYDDPSGAKIGVIDPDPENYAYTHFTHPDHKAHLFDETIDEHIKYITPEKEDAALCEEMGDYPMLLSSGNHGDDGGHNGVMRNPATYKYRNPGTLLVNPIDAKNLGIKDGEWVELSTKRHTVKVEVEYAYGVDKGYCMIPHHYGMEKDGKVFYGVNASELVRGQDNDPITGDPYLRWVPCRLTRLENN